MSTPVEVTLTPTIQGASDRSVDLMEFGFRGFVSNDAMREIKRQEARATRAVTTAMAIALR